MRNIYTLPRQATMYALDLKFHILNSQTWPQRNILSSGPPGCMHTFITGAWSKYCQVHMRSPIF